MKHLKVGVALVLGVWGTSLHAQDIHFSQFAVAPMVYNPALAGVFDGDYRFIGNQRTQWRSVTVPYTTIGGSADWSNAFNRDGIGSAFSLYQDRAGDSRLNTIALNLAGSLRIAQSADSAHTFTAGVQFGFVHRKIDYTDLRYDNQWNGVQYNPGLDPGEGFARDARMHAHLALGVGWQYRRDRRNEYQAGMALHNANRPQQSFFDDPSIKLDMRFSLSAWGTRELNADWDAVGGLLLSRQGTYTEFIPVAGARYIIMNERGLFRTMFAHVAYRTRDAGFFTLGMDYDQWRGAVSYDFNTSSLRPASNGRGGLEVSLVYIFTKFRPPVDRRVLCPDYL